MNAQLQQPQGRIIADEAPDSYYVRRLDEANASGLKQMLRSPAHFAEWVRNPDADKTSPALNFGKAFHMATLEPDVFDARYIVVPEDAPRYPTAAQWNAKTSSPDSMAAKDWWRAFNETHAGKERLATPDYDRARRMADSVRAHPVAAGLLVGGDREVTFRWQDEETGLACKARADLYLRGEYLMDLKSCRDASHEGFARAVASYHYDLQQAHYLNGIQSAGDTIRWMIFLAVESESPYVAQPYILDAAAEQRGWALRQKAIKRQAECLTTNQWPGYSTKLDELTLPAWAHYGVEQ